MSNEEKNKKYLNDMADWGRATGQWILDNPDKDWLMEYIEAHGGGIVTQDEGGDRPPIKPPNP